MQASWKRDCRAHITTEKTRLTRPVNFDNPLTPLKINVGVLYRALSVSVVSLV